MNFYVLLTLFSAFFSLALGAYIFLSNPKAQLNRLYSLVSLVIAFWCFAFFLLFIAKTPQAYLLAEKMGTVGSSLAAVFLLHFYLCFTKKKPGKMLLVLLYLIQAFFVALNWAAGVVDLAVKSSPEGYLPISGPLYVPYTGTLVAYVSIGLFLCYKSYKKARLPKEKSQARLVMIAAGIPLVFGISFEILPVVFGLAPFQFTSAISAIASFFIGYAMIKYGLMVITPEMAVENIINTMPDYLVVINADGNIVLANPSCLNAFGYARRKMMGLRLNVFFPEERGGLFEKIRKNEDLKNYEAQISLKDKKVLFVSINSSKLKNKFGSIIGYVLVMRDIKETRRLIKGLEEKTKELEQSRKEIEKSEKELKQKVEELEKFQRISVNRELKMVDLKKQIKELKDREDMKRRKQTYE